jgi:hypothetical protein
MFSLLDIQPLTSRTATSSRLTKAWSIAAGDTPVLRAIKADAEPAISSSTWPLDDARA